MTSIKKQNFYFLLFLLFVSAQVNGQIGNLKNKVVSKATEVVKDESKNTTSTTEKQTAPKPINVTANDMEKGKAYFYTSFKPSGFFNEVTSASELFVRMNIGKTMIEASQEKGISVDYTAYGFITVYIDDTKAFTSGPISFASNISKKWLYIDIPLSVNPDFVEKISNDQSMIETEQDVWVFQQLFQDNGIPKKYAEAAFKSIKTGNHTVKVELGMGESDSKEPKAVICTGQVKILGDGTGNSKNAPKHLRPLKDSEKGNFVFSSATFTPGNGELTATLELPNPPKFYNMKWCKASSCDYDNGYIEFYVSLNDVPVAAWSSKLEGTDYTSDKSFKFYIIPKTDEGIGVVEAPFNSSKLFKSENTVVYALLDLLYSGNVKVGTNKLSIKAYSKECIPLNTEYEFDHNYFAQWPPIAETTIDLIVTEEGLKTLANNSSAKKLTHATGEWVAIDNKLKNSNTGSTENQIIDVATKTEWKIVKNSLGAIIYRQCKADVIYKSKYGYRMQKGVLVKQDYNGGTYGNPYFAERVEYMHGPSLLNSTHIPVPAVKVK